MKDNKTAEKQHVKIDIRSVSSGVHSALLHVLAGNPVPRKDRTPAILAAYRIKSRKIAQLSNINNPLNGQNEERVIIVDPSQKGEGRILLQNREVQACIKKYYTKYRGVGARKLYNVISKTFCGISERDIQMFLNSQQSNQQLNPTFMNKQPIKPVDSKQVMGQVQMDIVDLQRSAIELDGKVFKYVLVVMDVFSRFIFLRPLQGKSSLEVASHIMQIFSDAGVPKIIQSDQGTEFKGVVERVMERMSVRIIHSRPYHPQSQGKVFG